MSVDDIIKFIQAVGFPIAVAAYVLIRMEYTQRELIKSINALTNLLATRGIRFHSDKDPKDV
jgi:hypothetical protein